MSVAVGATMMRVRSPWISANRWLESPASGLTRGCDVVAVLDDGPLLIILLPETDVSGAGRVLERLRSAIGDTHQEWEFGLFEYPQNKVEVQELMEQAA